MLDAGVDWETTPPEKIKGIKLNHKVNWDALRYVIQKADMSQLEKQLMTKRLIKTIKNVGIENLDPATRHSYCCARLALGDFSDYWGWEFRGSKNPDESKGWAAELYWQETWLPKWAGGYVDRLLVLGEQGVGDAIFYASIIPECMIRVKQVVYETEPRLHSLLERSLPGLECDKEHAFEERRPGDAYIPAAELLRMFRRARNHFPARPYLHADPKRVEEMEIYRDRVGISWLGRQGRIDPNELGIENPVSLQYNETRNDIDTPPIDLKNDIEGIVALCSVLSKVVTVPTSVHHFAGAAGKRVEIIKPPPNSGEVINQITWDYSTEYGGKLPWYPDVQVYNSLKDWRAGLLPR